MKKLRVTVDGKTYDVEVEILEDDEADGAALPTLAAPRAASRPAPAAAAPAAAPARAPAPAPASSGGGAGTVISPIAGIIVEYKAQPGASFKEGEVLVIIEAMKMNTNINAPSAGTVKELSCKAGDAVKQGQVLLTYQ